MPDRLQLSDTNTQQMESEADEPPLGLSSLFFHWGNRVVLGNKSNKGADKGKKMPSIIYCCPRSAIGIFYF